MTAKVIPFPGVNVEPESAWHEAEAERICAEWQRILGVRLDIEQTAQRLAQLERWEETKPKTIAHMKEFRRVYGLCAGVRRSFKRILERNFCE